MNRNNILGYNTYDLVIIVIQLILFLPPVFESQIWDNSYFRLIISVWFFIAILLKMFDSNYSHGVKKVFENFPGLDLVMLVGGFFVGAIAFAIGIVGPTYEILELLTGVDREILFNHWISIIVILPSIIIFPLIIPVIYSSALESKKDFYVPLGNENILRVISRIGILLMANFLLINLYDTFISYPEVVEEGLGVIESVIDFGFNFFIVGFMVTIFYLPVRAQEYFLNPNGNHFRSYLQTVLTLTLIYMSIDPILAKLFL